MKLAIAIPTYNEAANMKKLLPALHKNLVRRPGLQCSVFIIDDNSPDGTADVVRVQAKNLTTKSFSITLLSREKKEGLGRAYVFAFHKILAKNFDYLLQMDADLSHDPKYIPAFLDATETSDFVVGSRYIGGGATPDWSFKRKLLSRGGNLYTRLFLGSRLTDYTGGFNLYSTDLLRKIKLDSLQAGGYGFLIELKYQALKKCQSVSQVPIVFMDRQHGTSKIPSNTLLANLILVPKLKFGNKLQPSMDYKKILFYASPLIIYLIVAYLLWGPNHFTDIHRDIFTPSGDPLASVWYLRWWPFSIAHGLNPIFERYAYYPNGFNLAWSTSISTLAFIMAPVTAIWGALTSFNVLALVALPFSALCCYYLIYYLTKKYWASVLCGFIYGFSSFQLGELLGHNCFYVSFIPPLVVLAVLTRVKGRLGKIPFIIFLAVLLAMQFGIATEGFGSMFLFGAAAWILSLIFVDTKLRSKLRATTIEIAWATVVALIILSPFIYYLFKGYSGVPKVINSPIGYSADLLNFIIPTKITFIGGHLFENVSKNFAGNPSEQGAYLSIPLIAFIVWYGIYNWRKWYAKVLVILSALIGVASLGPRLQINGHIFKSFPMPWAITTHLPVLSSMLPTRFPMYIFLLAAIMLGLWLSDKSKTSQNKKRQTKAKFIRASKYGLVVLVIVLLLPATSNYFWAKPNDPPLFTPKLTREYIGLNKNILILPLSDGADPEFWQVASNMEFKTTDGYLGFVPSFVINSPITVQVSSDLPGPDFVNNFLGFLKSNDITEIVYTPAGLPQSITIIKIINGLGWTTFNAGGATIIKVPLQYQ